MPYANLYPPQIKDFRKSRGNTLATCGKCNRPFNVKFGIPCDNFGMCHKYICRNCRPLIKTKADMHYYCATCAPHFSFQVQSSCDDLMVKIAKANDFRICGEYNKADELEEEIINELVSD